MQTGNPWLWLAWFLFGTYLVLLLWRKYLPAVLEAPPVPREAARPFPAWLFCEEGAPLDRRVGWFELRPALRNVVGGQPRAATADTFFVYLTADDIRDDHALIRFDPDAGRYRVSALGAATVLHNNDPLNDGQDAELADGDTLDLGRVSRFRFTLTGPEEA